MNSLLITLVFMTFGQNDFDRSQVPQFLADFQAKYDPQIGQPVRYKIRYLASSACSKWSDDIGTSARAKRMWCLAGLARRRFTRRGVVHFLIPPITSGEHKFIAGVSIMKCASAVNYSVVENYNIYGQERYLHSIVAFAHELGHSLGADHIKTPTVMNADALPFIKDKLLDFDEVSIQEIRGRCF